MLLLMNLVVTCQVFVSLLLSPPTVRLPYRPYLPPATLFPIRLAVLVTKNDRRGSNLLDFEHALPFAHFVLEDARQAVFRPTFAEIPDWEVSLGTYLHLLWSLSNGQIQQSLHQFLLRVYPVNDPGHAAIETWSYLLHNASREQDILPSSPCIKPLRDLISPDDRVQMSIIFQISELEAASLNEKCPACKTAWSDPSAVNVTWSVDAFLARYHLL